MKPTRYRAFVVRIELAVQGAVENKWELSGTASSSGPPVECGICKCSVEGNCECPACNQLYCQQPCLETWLQRDPKCPYCKAPCEIGTSRHNSFAQKIVDVHTETVGSSRKLSTDVGPKLEDGGGADIDETVRFLKCGRCKELAYWNLECPSCSQVRRRGIPMVRRQPLLVSHCV